MIGVVLVVTQRQSAMGHANLLAVGVNGVLLCGDRVVCHGEDEVKIVLADIDIEVIFSGRRVYDFLGPWFHTLANARCIFSTFAVKIDLYSFGGGILDIFGLCAWYLSARVRLSVSTRVYSLYGSTYLQESSSSSPMPEAEFSFP